MTFFRRMQVTRTTRLQQYLDRLHQDIPLRGKEDKEHVRLLGEKIGSVFVKMRVLGFIRMFFYLLLYASIVSNFIADLVTANSSLIGRFAEPFVIMSTIIGTTISLLLILLFTRVINTYWEDARTYATHMIAIYAKNEKPSRQLDVFLRKPE
jgi:hypothetical protein